MSRSASAWRRFPISPYVRFFLTPLPKIVYKWPYQEASFICFLNSILKLLDNVSTPYSLLYSLIDIKLSKYAVKFW